MSEPAGPDQPDLPFGDVLRDAPLLREIQRVLMSSPGPVNWELARQIGIAMAAGNGDDPIPTDPDRQGFADSVRLAELEVADFTSMPMPGELAKVEAFRRGQWVEANIASLRDLLDPVASKLAAAMAGQGPPGLGGLPAPAEGDEQQQLMAGVMQQMAPLLLGAQVGMVLGYLAQRVLGQFDLAVPRSSGSLFFVVPNIASFERDWSLDPREFRAYVALHEVTHHFEFSRPWVRDHFLHLVRDLVEHAEIDLSSLEQRMEGLDPSNPEALTDAFEELGNLFGEAGSPEQRLRLARVQAFMSAAEGYGDHVADALGRRMLSSFGQIDEALRRFREGRHGDRALERLLGLEVTEEQYRSGRSFCDTVAEQTEEATLSRMWGSAGSLPSMPELDQPTLWLSRMA